MNTTEIIKNQCTLQFHAYQKPERFFSHLGSKAQEQVVLVLIGVCTSIYDLTRNRHKMKQPIWSISGEMG